jgi:hypothetical protein
MVRFGVEPLRTSVPNGSGGFLVFTSRRWTAAGAGRRFGFGTSYHQPVRVECGVDESGVGLVDAVMLARVIGLASMLAALVVRRVRS